MLYSILAPLWKVPKQYRKPLESFPLRSEGASRMPAKLDSFSPIPSFSLSLSVSHSL